MKRFILADFCIRSCLLLYHLSIIYLIWSINVQMLKEGLQKLDLIENGGKADGGIV